MRIWSYFSPSGAITFIVENIKTYGSISLKIPHASSVLADYGFNCLRLNDDWKGADFIAVPITGISFPPGLLKFRIHINSENRVITMEF